MNVVLVGIALWAVLDGLLLSQLRTQPRSAHRVLLILEVVLAVLAVAALLADEPVRSVSFWSVGVLLNTALAAVGLPRRRILAVTGIGLTLTALALLGLHSFASLPVIAAASVISAGSCLPYPLSLAELHRPS